jgi:hypothetical protein
VDRPLLKIALLIDQKHVWTGRITKFLILLPYAVPPIANGLIWSFLYNFDFGFLNRILFTFGLIHEAYRGVYPAIEGTPWLPLVRLVLAVLALAPATILMGATFPSLMRHLTNDASLGTAFGRLYAANTIGAIVGTLAAGLVLIEMLGLSVALAVGAVVL